MAKRVISPNISVDCVLLGYDGEGLRVLLVKQVGKELNGRFNDRKLPGSLIYEDEDLDDAAVRVLYELTGINDIPLIQFRAFGSMERTKNPKDVKWLEHFHSLNCRIDRIVTIAYFAMLRIDCRTLSLSKDFCACWENLDNLGELAFDHNQIIEQAILHIRNIVDLSPDIILNLLPHKFTIAQLRHLYEIIYDKKFDIRNFHKKISNIDYIVPLDDFQVGVAHRAARYYKFDKKIYQKFHVVGKIKNR